MSKIVTIEDGTSPEARRLMNDVRLGRKDPEDLLEDAESLINLPMLYQDAEPVHGWCWIEMERQYAEIEDGIFIADRSQVDQNLVGKCVKMTLYRDMGQHIYNKGYLVDVGVAVIRHINNYCRDMIGTRVIVETSSLVAGRVYQCRLEHVLAIDYSNEVAATPSPDEVRRCTRCQSAGAYNILLDDFGYCVRCKRDLYGNHVRDREFASCAELEDALTPEDRRVSSTVYSTSK